LTYRNVFCIIYKVRGDPSKSFNVKATLEKSKHAKLKGLKTVASCH